ncbi:MAG: efflux RND transporter periplasmic adaptor subunit [Phycisphaerae bacterium]|nr:efflux RND transporter periplasmic adaptor subunit [Phycisphaerae bacterium]MCZ2399560.1 efflux RND transporter periplasmic adaptor subunit [Phycisphaerae bacterium]
MSDVAPTTVPLVETPYAASRPARRLTARRWLIGGGIVVVIAGMLGLRQTDAWRWLTGASAGGASVFVVQPGDLQIVLSEDGELKARESIELRNEVEGASTILFLVPESTRVRKGDLLVELASDELKERLDQEQLTLSTTRAAYEAAVQELEITRNENASKLKKCTIDRDVAELELRQYLEGEFPKQVSETEINIKQTMLEIDRKKDELEKNTRLFERKFVTQSKIEQLNFELEKLNMTLDKHRLARTILLDYDRPKVEKQKRSALEQAEQELERERARSESRERQAVAKSEEQKGTLAMREKRVARLEEQLRKTKVLAPIDGVVQYPTDSGWRMNDSVLAVGQKVYEGQTLLILPNTTQMIVSMRIHEADRHKVAEGMPVQVRVPAVPGQVFTGKISKIARFADSAHRWLNPNLKEHASEILLDQTDAPVSPGDSADIKIFIDQLSNVLAVPVQSVYTRGTRSFVFVSSLGQPRLTEVKLGQSSTSMVEIVSGLSAGDRVLMRADDRLLAMLPPANTPTLDVPPPVPPVGPGGGPAAQRQGASRAERDRPGRGERGRQAAVAGTGETRTEAGAQAGSTENSAGKTESTEGAKKPDDAGPADAGSAKPVQRSDPAPPPTPPAGKNDDH